MQLSAKFSRSQESEADLYSYNFLKRNNYSVMGEITAFHKLAKLRDGAQQSTLDKMTSSHPDSEQRAATIENYGKKRWII